VNTVTTFTKRENDVLPVALLKGNVDLNSSLQRVLDALSCFASSSGTCETREGGSSLNLRKFIESFSQRRGKPNLKYQN